MSSCQDILKDKAHKIFLSNNLTQGYHFKISSQAVCHRIGSNNDMDAQGTNTSISNRKFIKSTGQFDILKASNISSINNNQV
jgi:hypothetical protein